MSAQFDYVLDEEPRFAMCVPDRRTGTLHRYVLAVDHETEVDMFDAMLRHQIRYFFTPKPFIHRGTVLVITGNSDAVFNFVTRELLVPENIARDVIANIGGNYNGN